MQRRRWGVSGGTLATGGTRGARYESAEAVGLRYYICWLKTPNISRFLN